MCLYTYLYVYLSTYVFGTCMCPFLSPEKVEEPTSRDTIRHVRLYSLSDTKSPFKTFSLNAISPWDHTILLLLL